VGCQTSAPIAADRLTSATVGGTAASYTYDGDGTRVSKTVGEVETPHLWDRQAGPSTRSGRGLPLLLDDALGGGSGVPPSRDYFNGMDPNVVMASTFDQALTGLAAQLGSTPLYPIFEFAIMLARLGLSVDFCQMGLIEGAP
jgi:YD repeat-containing protein